MIHNVVLEKLDANMEEATVGAWRLAEGETIAEGEPLVELITDKVTFDLESPVSGTLRRAAAAPGSVVPVGYVLCQIGEADSELPEIDAANQALVEAHKAKQAVEIETGDGPAPKRQARGERVRATPAARRLAKQHGLELSDVTPAEPGGILSEEDVRRHVEG